MPILKRVGINHHLEDFEEIDEHSPYFDPNKLYEKEDVLIEKTKPVISFWKKWWTALKLFFRSQNSDLFQN